MYSWPWFATQGSNQLRTCQKERLKSEYLRHDYRMTGNCAYNARQPMSRRQNPSGQSIASTIA